MKKIDRWNTAIFQASPIIQQLYSVTGFFSNSSSWPTISEYRDIFNKCHVDITPVPQSHTITQFEEQYEPRVYLKKELQTRTHNWHDFFNAMVWLSFPGTKSTLNQLHYQQAVTRPKGSNRTALENRITQFDECGAILISNNEALLELIKNHQWEAFFIDNKELLRENFRCVVFGHAIFEKALNPYPGMTCHCISLYDNELLLHAKNHQYELLDQRVADIWQNTANKQLLKLKPFPILGMPGYWPVQDADFYQNKSYFR